MESLVSDITAGTGKSLTFFSVYRLYCEKKRLRQRHDKRTLNNTIWPCMYTLTNQEVIGCLLLCAHHSLSVGHHKRSWPPFKETLLMGENLLLANHTNTLRNPNRSHKSQLHDRTPNLLPMNGIPLEHFHGSPNSERWRIYISRGPTFGDFVTV
jgi:hypothetical protein